MTSAKVISEQQTVTFRSSFLKISSLYQRLSRIAGAKLTNNNPHIADLVTTTDQPNWRKNSVSYMMMHGQILWRS